MFDLNSNDADLQKESRSVSMTGDGITVARVYIIDDTDDPEKVPALLRSHGIDIGTPHPSLPDLYLSDVTTEPMVGRVKATLNFAPQEHDAREDENGEVWEWSLATSQTHITAVDDPSKQDHCPTWADTGTAIGVNGDDVEGADVYRPTGALRVTKRMAASAITSTFRRRLIDASATVNAAAWKDWNEKEVLFLGADLGPISSTEWRVVYNFLFSRSGISIVRLIDLTLAQITPDPWAHVWFRYAERFRNTTDDKRVKYTGIESVHVARIYEESDFRYLGIESSA